MTPIAHDFIPVGDHRFHVAIAGRPDAPLVLLLHGFPEFWYGWRHQIEPISEAGYFVLAPDQRGYNLSDKPLSIEAYSLEHLSGDVCGMMDAVGRKSAIILGHDWGGIVAWFLAARFPERVEKLVILNSPHPRVFKRFLPRSPGQIARSWYMFFFQIPRIPEIVMRTCDWRILEAVLQHTSRPGTFGKDELDHYRQAWNQPLAARCMLNWYRALFRARSRMGTSRIDVPALILWGARDAFLKPQLAQAAVAHCSRGKLVLMEEASHWIQHEEPGRINPLILEFLRRPQ